MGFRFLAATAFLLFAALVNSAALPYDSLEAIAVLQPTVNNTAWGYAIWQSSSSFLGVKVFVNISGLSPNSVHGFHVHEFGDVSSPDGLAAGGHFNPTGKLHGCDDPYANHVGDLGNLASDVNGNAITTIYNPVQSLSPENIENVAGRSIILHANRDDCATQPTGDSGQRISQGVIGYRNTTRPYSTLT